MGVDKVPARYVIYVPAGMSVSAAEAEHRERTGYGGMCFFVFRAPATKAA